MELPIIHLRTSILLFTFFHAILLTKLLQIVNPQAIISKVKYEGNDTDAPSFAVCTHHRVYKINFGEFWDVLLGTSRLESTLLVPLATLVQYCSIICHYFYAYLQIRVAS